MDKEDAAELMDAQEQISAGSLASCAEVVRTLLEAHQDAAAFGVISIPELGAAWCRYTQWYAGWVASHPDVEGGPSDDVVDAHVDSWAGTLIFSIPSQEYLRDLLLHLVEAAPDDVLPSVAARFVEDYVWDGEECLAWVEQQCAASERFRRTLTHAWLWSDMSESSFARLEAAARVPLANPNRHRSDNDPNE